MVIFMVLLLDFSIFSFDLFQFSQLHLSDFLHSVAFLFQVQSMFGHRDLVTCISVTESNISLHIPHTRLADGKFRVCLFTIFGNHVTARLLTGCRELKI